MTAIQRSKDVTMASVTNPVVGFVGAGQLGAPTVTRLADAGLDVRLFARRAEVRAAFADGPVTLTDSVADAARGVDVLVLFVFTGDQLRETLLGDRGALAVMAPGSVVLVHTTASVKDLEEIADAASAHGVHVVDGPVSGTATDILAGRLTVLLGGADEAVQRCLDVVAAYAEPVVHVGGLGAAMRVKLINNVVFAAHVQIAAAAVTAAESIGLDPQRCLEAILKCSGASAAMGHLLGAGGDPVAFGERIGPYLRKDVAACVQTADELGADLGPLLGVVRSGPLLLT
jgi:3-hydroxyisobutyrate dehydrogenase-like beta-hydroxyacid dehydrogenase